VPGLLRRGFTIPHPDAWRDLSLSPEQLREYTSCLDGMYPWERRRAQLFWRGTATGCSRGWPLASRPVGAAARGAARRQRRGRALQQAAARRRSRRMDPGVGFITWAEHGGAGEGQLGGADQRPLASRQQQPPPPGHAEQPQRQDAQREQQRLGGQLLAPESEQEQEAGLQALPALPLLLRNKRVQVALQALPHQGCMDVGITRIHAPTRSCLGGGMEAPGGGQLRGGGAVTQASAPAGEARQRRRRRAAQGVRGLVDAVLRPEVHVEAWSEFKLTLSLDGAGRVVWVLAWGRVCAPGCSNPRRRGFRVLACPPPPPPPPPTHHHRGLHVHGVAPALPSQQQTDSGTCPVLCPLARRCRLRAPLPADAAAALRVPGAAPGFALRGVVLVRQQR